MMNKDTIHLDVEAEKLNKACHEVMLAMSALHGLKLANALFTWSLTTHHFVVLGMSLLGFYATKRFEPENWKLLAVPCVYLGVQDTIAVVAYILAFDFTLANFFGFAVTAGVGALQLLSSFALWRALQARAVHTQTLYLNVVVCNKDEVLENKLQQKMGKAGRFFSRLASAAVSNDRFTAKIADKMANMLPDMMNRMGLTVESSICFKKDNFFVLKLSILAVDLPKLVKEQGKQQDEEAEKQKSSNMSVQLEGLLARLPSAVREDIQHALNLLVATQMLKKMPVQMAEKMKAKGGLEVEVVGCSQQEQAAQFFDILEAMENHADKSKDRDSKDSAAVVQSDQWNLDTFKEKADTLKEKAKLTVGEKKTQLKAKVEEQRQKVDEKASQIKQKLGEHSSKLGEKRTQLRAKFETAKEQAKEYLHSAAHDTDKASSSVDAVSRSLSTSKEQRVSHSKSCEDGFSDDGVVVEAPSMAADAGDAANAGMEEGAGGYYDDIPDAENNGQEIRRLSQLLQSIDSSEEASSQASEFAPVSLRSKLKAKMTEKRENFREKRHELKDSLKAKLSSHSPAGR